jgi:antibiotic biosynthesis monooxygenase (ABM) superfamily enzyme
MTSPVIRVVHSRTKEGCHTAYEALILGMFESMKHFPGFLGSELLPPMASSDEYQVIVKFSSQKDLDQWDVSTQREMWHARFRPLLAGEPEYHLLTGLEAWFSLPEIPAGKKPPRNKMAFITWLGIWPTASFFLYFLSPYIESLPYLLRSAIVTGLVVITMTYLLMPRLTKLFKEWLSS